MLLFIRESQKSRKVSSSINSTFISLIPKTSSPSSFDDFRPISCCNQIYKIISKTIAQRLKPILSSIISKEQFGFLFKRQIHDVVSLAQEALHSVHIRKSSSISLKLDLSKAYDRVNWNFLRILLIQIGLDINMIECIMGCIQSASFVVIINESPSSFFRASRGLH